MLVKTLLFLTTAALSAATPVRRQGGGPCTARPPPGQTAVPTLPEADNGDHELAAPPANTTTLSVIGLGHGIQNYTCVAADDGTLSAKALGALAVLYDITSLYPGSGSPNALSSTTAFSQLPVPVLEMLPLPLSLNETAKSDTSVPAAYPPFIDPPESITMKGVEYPFVGRHYFDESSVPTFDLLSTKGIQAKLKKDDATPAPEDAYAGPMGTGAVAWLLLSDNGESQGVDYVYRVNTAGGNPQECNEAGETGSVSYSAMYWFYVPV